MAIQLADQVAKQAGDVVHSSYMADCADLKAKTERLVALLRQAARADLYERPTLWIMYDTLQVLEKTQAIVAKCSAHGLLKRVFTINPAAAFKKMSAQLDNSIGDVSGRPLSPPPPRRLLRTAAVPTSAAVQSLPK